MRHRTHTVFDDYIKAGDTVTSDASHNSMLGAHDMLALHALADNASVLGNVDIFLQHSSEGRNWLYRQNNSVSQPPTGDIRLAMTAAGDFQQKMWSDACLATSSTGPLLSFVRVLIVTVPGVHLKVHATLRGGLIG